MKLDSNKGRAHEKALTKKREAKAKALAEPSKPSKSKKDDSKA